MRAAGNPGGVGHGWVKNRFIEGKVPERLYEYKSVLDDGTEIVRTRVFIPAKLSDNLILQKMDPGYIARLMELEPHLQKALIHGDWDIFAGQVFEEFRREKHVVRPISLDRNWFKFASGDWGLHPHVPIGNSAPV